MGQDETQKRLSLKFESKRFWPDFRRELKLDQTGAAIILDICGADDWVAYSRTARHYDRPHRYRNPLYTYRKVVGAVDMLANRGLIEHDYRPPGSRGWQSALKATFELRGICAGIIGGAGLTLAKPAEVVLLRDINRRLIDYKETRDIDRMRRRLQKFNEAIMGGGINPTVTAPLARIFNGDMARGGRFYAMGASWQNMKSEARKTLTIDGEPVAELDYKNMHPAILYAEVGAAMPAADCYQIEGWPRQLVKVATLTLINAKTIHAARHSIAHNDMMSQWGAPGGQNALQAADRLIKAIKRLHKPIAHAFHSDAGARLMGIDADIAEAVMTIMLSKGVVVLPVHDSFLVQASKVDELEAAMMEAAHKAGLYALQVEAKKD